AAAARPVVRVLDAAGHPVAGAEVHVHAPSAERPLFAWQAICRGTTGEDGTVCLGGLDPARSYVLVVEPGGDLEDVQEIERADWKPADGTVRLGALRNVSGTVLDAEGFPVRRGRIEWRPAGDEAAGWTEERLGSDGSFAIRAAPAGAIEVRASVARGVDRYETIGAAAAAESASQVKIVAAGLSAVTVRVAGWPGGAGFRATLSFATESTSGRWSAEMPGDGRIRFHFLPSEGDREFRFYAGPLPDGRIAWAAVTEGAESAVDLMPGLTIRGRLTVPAGAQVESVRAFVAGGNLMLEGRVDGNDSYVIEGLPPGRCHVSAHAQRGESHCTGSAEAEAGGTADIVLSKR
ncbi:MAG: carboxypeptidase-like regulatory domain-containing protein, partial [Planctomycetes bacterium]|nr:carboxypeptidase-like regulatory domain-containing protein [Planctomycetota bacterium]